MKPETRRYITVIAVLSIGVMLATSLVTNPGFTSVGLDKATDVERVFGWPCEYYADLWKATSAPATYPGIIAVLPIPPSSMTLAYSDFDIFALMLNGIFIACFAILAILLGYSIDRQRVEPIIGVSSVGLILLACTIFLLADTVGASL